MLWAIAGIMGDVGGYGKLVVKLDIFTHFTKTLV